jgi:hypothetical protein
MRSTLHDPLLTPENRLWRAVLEQAYTDAESGCEALDESDDQGYGPPLRIRARFYLRGDNKQEAASLSMVCGFAEVPADRVLNWARRNYPRPKSQAPSPSLNALAIGASEARQNRAQICEHTAA